MTRSHFLTVATGALAAMASPAYALNVGEARVLSFADQPLRVLIPIKAQGWEWREMWASAQTYQVGLGLTATLYKPTGERTEGVIEIRSKAPITEPIVDVQITFETGHRTTVHRTPILIDVQQKTVSIEESPGIPQNPVIAHQRSASSEPIAKPSVSPTVQKSTASNTVQPRPASGQAPSTYPQNGPFPEVQAIVTPPNEHVRASSYKAPPEFSPASARASQNNIIPVPPSLSSKQANGAAKPAAPGPDSHASHASHASQYVVKPGDGLYSIANKNKPALWSTEETMAYIFKHNRSSFAGHAYNTLKAGAVLTFSWTGAVQNQEAHNTREASPDLRIQTAQRVSSNGTVFTERDARAAVLRHRMVEIQQELNMLQGGSSQ